MWRQSVIMGKRRLHTDNKQLTKKCNANKTALAKEAPSLIWNKKHTYWPRMQPNFSCKGILKSSHFNFLKVRNFNYFKVLQFDITDLYLLLSTPGYVFVLILIQKRVGEQTQYRKWQFFSSHWYYDNNISYRSLSLRQC